MKVGDLVTHKLYYREYPVGIVTRIYSYAEHNDRMVVWFPSYGRCTFKTIDLEPVKKCP